MFDERVAHKGSAIAVDLLGENTSVQGRTQDDCCDQFPPIGACSRGLDQSDKAVEAETDRVGERKPNAVLL